MSQDDRVAGDDAQLTRRGVLTATGAAAAAGVAGCIGGDGGDDGDGGSDDGGDGSADGASDGGGDGSDDDGSAEPAGGADVVLVDHELVTDDPDATHSTYVDAGIENRGDDRSGMIGVTLEWFDGSGESIGEDLRRLPTLGAGETWIPHLDPIDASADDVEDYEASLDFLAAPPTEPADVAVTDHTLVIGESTATVEVTVSNDGEDDLDYLEAQALVYDEDDRVVAGNWDGATEVEAGESGTIEIRIWNRDRVNEEGRGRAVYLATEGQSGEL